MSSPDDEAFLCLTVDHSHEFTAGICGLCNCPEDAYRAHQDQGDARLRDSWPLMSTVQGDEDDETPRHGSAGMEAL